MTRCSARHQRHRPCKRQCAHHGGAEAGNFLSGAERADRLAIGDEAGLMPCIMELAKAKREYEKVRSALEQVEATGYGIVMPTVSELKLEQPQIVRQGTNYGVRLEACAPSIQMMKAPSTPRSAPSWAPKSRARTLPAACWPALRTTGKAVGVQHLWQEPARAGERGLAEQAAAHAAGGPHPPAGNAGTGHQ